MDPSSQDIDPQESISQIGSSFISTATSSQAVGALSSQASFLHHFHREEAEFKHGDQYMIVMNDPVILERARNMLGVKAILLNVF